MIQTSIRPLASVALLASASGLLAVFGPGGQTAALQAARTSAGSADRIQFGLEPTCMSEIPGVPVSVCFVPNASPAEVEQVIKSMRATWAADLAARDAEAEGGAAYELGTRWNINGSSAQGAPVTLRWSMPADGLSIPDGLSGGAASPNNLNATFTTKFGSVEAGKNLVRQVFARWSELSGVTYTEVTDDNAVWGSSGGTTRGDIRIVGRTFGSSGVLAYNYFPNNGDMVIVTSNSGFWSTTNNNRYFRNIIAHEHGHGLGFEHVCPINQTKLMEPTISTAFDGPQNDDIRCVQRAYGDNYEPNDTMAAGNTTVITGAGIVSKSDCSIDDNLDIDFYRFSATANSTISVTVAPVGPTTYLSGPQNTNGSCSAGTSVSPRLVHDLNVQVVRGSTGATVVATAAATAAGGAETLTSILLPAADTYAVRVYPSSASDDVQVYSITVTLNLAPVRPTDVNGDGIVDGADLGILLGTWGPVACGSIYDFTGDCKVDGADLGILLGDWG